MASTDRSKSAFSPADLLPPGSATVAAPANDRKPRSPAGSLHPWDPAHLLPPAAPPGDDSPVFQEIDASPPPEPAAAAPLPPGAGFEPMAPTAFPSAEWARPHDDLLPPMSNPGAIPTAPGSPPAPGGFATGVPAGNLDPMAPMTAFPVSSWNWPAAAPSGPPDAAAPQAAAAYTAPLQSFSHAAAQGLGVGADATSAGYFPAPLPPGTPATTLSTPATLSVPMETPREIELPRAGRSSYMMAARARERSRRVQNGLFLAAFGTLLIAATALGLVLYNRSQRGKHVATDANDRDTDTGRRQSAQVRDVRDNWPRANHTPDRPRSPPAGSEVSIDSSLPAWEAPAENPGDLLGDGSTTEMKPESEGEPDPKPDMPMPTVKPTPEELQALSASVAAAREKLTERAFGAVIAELDKASGLAKVPEHQAKVRRLRDLTHYAREATRLVDAAIAGLKGQEEIDYKGDKIVIVERNETKLVFKYRGKRLERPLAELPPGLVFAIFDARIQASPENKVFKAAYVAILPDPDAQLREKAHAWLREAKADGVEIGDLELALDDSCDFSAEDPDES